MTVKNKISKSKRNNQKHNKLIKKGLIRKTPKKSKRIVQDLPTKVVKGKDELDEESDDGEDLLEMVEDDDIEFLKSAISKRSYKLLNRVKYTGGKKRTHDDESIEQKYEEFQEPAGKKIKSLLPIKTKTGIVPQEIEAPEDEPREETEKITETKPAVDEEQSESEDYSLQDNTFNLKEPISTARLLAKRNELLRQRKIHIGTLSSGILENPDEKVTNFRTLLKLMDEETPEIYFTTQKLVIVSLLEVFKDILPEYEIKNIINDGIKLKKDTLKLHKFEENLLLYYKKFLQKLEKYCFALVKKMGDTRKRTEEEIKLGELAVRAMCDLLVAHPYFNYSQNIAQVIVPFLNNSNKLVRELVKNAVKQIFKEDKKEEVSLKILRIINHYLKTHAHNINVEIVEVLLALNLKDVNLDFEKEQNIKDKKLKANKQKILQMSKKERKRKKKLQMLEKEMLETKAEENKQTKQRNLTEITKIVFNIYFRILKNSSNTKVLGVCLEGLAKFAHCINLEFYVDIVNVLDNLLKEDWLAYREQLHCIQTVFIILSGHGEAITLDPTRFYNNLYKGLLSTNASKNHDNIPILLKTLNEALIKRRKKITPKRIIAFVKRLATLSLHLLHNGTLSSLGFIKSMILLNRSADILLDIDSSTGDGKFRADLDDPEYANAASTALYELILLNKHYHPVVRRFSKHIAYGVPSTGEESLSSEYVKYTPEQLFNDFDMSEMGFHPAVPVPSNVSKKNKPKTFQFSDSSFEIQCKQLVNNKKITNFWINI